MSFLEILVNLKSSYGENLTYTDNGVCLLGPCQLPKTADHFIFAPMPDELVQYLVQSYRYNVPDDLLTLSVRTTYAYSSSSTHLTGLSTMKLQNIIATEVLFVKVFREFSENLKRPHQKGLSKTE